MTGEERSDDRPLAERIRGVPSEIFDLPASAEDLKERLYRRTTAVLRTRRRRLVLVRIAAVAAVYLLGVATSWSRSRLPSRDVPLDERVAQRAPEGVGGGASSGAPETVAEGAANPSSSGARPEGFREDDPTEWERLAERGPLSRRIRYLRRAGDLYLASTRDVESALRCYRQMIELSPRKERASVDPADSWLLVALKSG